MPKARATRTVEVVTVRGSREYRERLQAVARDSCASRSMIIRLALAEWATRVGYTPPPNQ
jgi:predicted transcriptional regulator